jgi:hypothetical protein
VLQEGVEKPFWPSRSRISHLIPKSLCFSEIPGKTHNNFMPTGMTVTNHRKIATGSQSACESSVDHVKNPVAAVREGFVMGNDHEGNALLRVELEEEVE